MAALSILLSIALIFWIIYLHSRLNEQGQRLSLAERWIAYLSAGGQGRAQGQAAAAEEQPQRATYPTTVPQQSVQPAPQPEPRPQLSLPELTPERLLSIGGGLMVIIGAVFFLTLAINNGWIGEDARSYLALVGGIGFAVFGYVLGEKRGERKRIGDVSSIVVATGLAVSVLGAVVGTVLYDTWSETVGFLLALALGAATMLVANKWRVQDLAAVGIGVALLSPLLVWAEITIAQLGIFTVFLAAVALINSRRGWSWLNLAALVITLPMVGTWLVDNREDFASPAVGLVLLGVYWLLMLLSSLALIYRQQKLLGPASYTHLFTLATGVALIGNLYWENLEANSMAELSAITFGVAAAYYLLSGIFYAIKHHLLAITSIVIASLLTGVATIQLLAQNHTEILVLVLMAEASALAIIADYTKSWAARASAAGHALVAVCVFLTQPWPQIIIDDATAFNYSLVALAAYPGLGALIYLLRPQHLLTRRIAQSVVAVSAIATVTAVWSQLISMSMGTQASQTAVTILWVIGGIIVYAASFTRGTAWRWAGLGIIAICAAKLVLLDMQQLEAAPRVVAFVGSGLLLLGAAYFGQQHERDR